MDAGIVIREQEGYILRESSLQNMIRSLQKEMEFIFSSLNEVAKEIDERIK